MSSQNEKVRPVWEDGTPAYTIKQFGVVNEYDLSEEFPALTLRPVPFKNCVDELLWIWVKKSNRLADLSSRIWDAWNVGDGTIGKAYGFQLARRYDFGGRVMDQVDNVLWQLKNQPLSRRIMTNIYNFSDLAEMGLEPCAYSMTFNVTKRPDGSYILNAILNQRSQDVLAANAWNVCQYAVLVHLFARTAGMEVGRFIHVIADAHIYDRHVPIIRELIERENDYAAPQLWINPEKQEFYDFTPDDFELRDYRHGEQVKGIPIAV
jgi:thymidylate synthase